MAPGLVTAEKAARGKLPTDVWWHTIVSPTGRRRPATRRRSRRGSCDAWCRPPRGPETGASTPSRAPERSGRSARSWAAASSSSTRVPRPSRSHGPVSRGFRVPMYGYEPSHDPEPARTARFCPHQIAPAAHTRVLTENGTSASIVSLVIPARAEYIALGRLALSGLLRPLAVEPEVIADMKLALTEACSNSIRHAYDGGRDGAVEIRYELAVDRLAVEVLDNGRRDRSRPARGGDRRARRGRARHRDHPRAHG